MMDNSFGLKDILFKAILATNQWVRVQGERKDGPFPNSIHISGVSDIDVQNELYAMEKDGIIKSHKSASIGSDSWVLPGEVKYEEEIITKPFPGSNDKTYDINFKGAYMNPNLSERDALFNHLSDVDISNVMIPSHLKVRSAQTLDENIKLQNYNIKDDAPLDFGGKQAPKFLRYNKNGKTIRDGHTRRYTSPAATKNDGKYTIRNISDVSYAATQIFLENAKISDFAFTKETEKYHNKLQRLNDAVLNTPDASARILQSFYHKAISMLSTSQALPGTNNDGSVDTYINRQVAPNGNGIYHGPPIGQVGNGRDLEVVAARPLVVMAYTGTLGMGSAPAPKK